MSGADAGPLLAAAARFESSDIALLTIVLLLIAFGGVKLQSRIPFGPYISLAAAIWLFWGESILALYIGLMRP